MGIDPISLLIIGTVASAAGAGYTGYQSYQQGKDIKHANEEQARINQKNANQQADLETKAGASEAQQIREKGKRLLASQRASLANSGVKVDTGTGDILQKETKRLSEQDALTAIKDSGTRSRLLREGGADNAQMLRTEGKNAARAGKAGAVSGGLRAVGSVASGAYKIKRYSLLD